MKQFIKITLATITGIFVAFFLICLLLAGLIAGLASFADKEVTVKPNSVLHITLESEIMDRAPSNPLDDFDAFSFQSKKSLGLKDILDDLEKAKNDSRIKGIFLEVSGVDAGLSTVNEIRNALLDFSARGGSAPGGKDSSKFIVAYNDMYSQTAYYLSTAADTIFLNPEGLVEYRGMRTETPFLKGLLDKLEVEPQLIRHGKFKSAAEPLIQDKMSDANREQVTVYVSSLWEHILKGISDTRKIPVEELKNIADSLRLRNAQDALQYGFVDGLKFYDEVLADLRSRIGLGEKEKINFISLSKYSKAKPEDKKKVAKEEIAIVYASGNIVDGDGEGDNVGGDRFAKAIREARENEKVKAVVLRINSPGGSALASEVILREVILTKKIKPVVVSMGDVAASGGYYIACKADTIFANPTTITGSIGVFGIIPNAKGFFNNKLGVNFDGIKTNAHSDFPTIFRPMDNFEKRAIQQEVDRIYDSFISHVSAGRGISKESVDSIGQGRVWSGANAIEIDLIDGFGGLTDAIAFAAKKARLKDYRLLELPKEKEPLQQILEQISGEGEDALLKMRFGEFFPYLKQIENMKNYTGIQARLPYEILID